mmetsp:Transcript_21089/g.81860  ORF Transcript_21089/g.81860 Transcript_21089/m.81860 type:complete len:274 (-) Transcript_21089:129-950(-)
MNASRGTSWGVSLQVGAGARGPAGWRRRRRGFDALRRACMAVQRQAEGVALGVHVHTHDLERVAHERALDLLGAQVLVGAHVQRDDPVVGRHGAHARGRVVAVAAAGNLVDAAHALPQLAVAAPKLEVLLQKGAAARREVRRQRMQVARIVLLAVGRPALGLLPNVEGEGVDALGRNVPPLARAARAQVGRHVDGQALGRAPPAEAKQQRHDEQRGAGQAQGLHVRLQVRDLVLESAHGLPRRRDGSGRRRRVDHQPDRVMSWPPPACAASAG